MINKEVVENSCQPITVSENGPTISHLFFADDVLLFAKAIPKSARLMIKVLDEFCAMSGLNISKEIKDRI